MITQSLVPFPGSFLGASISYLVGVVHKPRPRLRLPEQLPYQHQQTYFAEAPACMAMQWVMRLPNKPAKSIYIGLF
jgi:hypothetical protein